MATVGWSHCVMACRIALMAIAGQARGGWVLFSRGRQDWHVRVLGSFSGLPEKARLTGAAI